MEVSWPENLSTSRKMVIRELMVGRELAKQLQSVLANTDGSGSEKYLVMKIVKSLSDTLFILNVKEGDEVSVFSQIQAVSSLDSPCLDTGKSEEYSQENCKSTTTTTTTTLPNKKNRRGCYDRRRTLQTWKRDSPTLINDGQAWRKYGQKMIHNAKYPRHYFRCSYKYDQGCKATKLVQRIQANPPLYRTTYLGHHTCKDLHKHPELILDCSGPEEDTSMFISFDNTNLSIKQEQPFCHLESPPGLMTMLSSTLESDHDHDNEDEIYGLMEFVDFNLDDFQFAS
ncbi:hypothetical protein FNV43_RR08612 [Rhamnella rubrinervis]|uniref:WRKY domain-containing protein n=1 Tax=Rhamnella rubrinervis TaxID=2594499 RepID=A0A8K0MJI1_9ROSA|nr:hypothetical protein FNV43_RR08612 [Rhamnella rubrinervis]